MAARRTPAKPAWRTKFKNWWPSLPIAAIIALPFQVQSCRLQEEQKTPHLSIDLRFGGVSIGPTEGRQDEVVTIPITVWNNSEAVALNVVLNLLISDGTGREADLNAYAKKMGSPVNQISRLGRNEPWRLSLAPSVMPNAKEQYKTGARRCKIIVQLTWQDVREKSYSQATLAELKYVPAIERYSEYFFWNPEQSFSSYGGRKEQRELKRHWTLPFKF